MAEVHIQDFTDGGVLAEDDLLHIQRQVSGQWTDFALRAQDATGSGLLPYVKIEEYELTDFYLDAIIEFLPDISGGGECYIPLHAWIWYEPSVEGLNDRPFRVYRDSGATSEVYRMVLDLGVQQVQVSPAGKVSANTYTQGLPGVWLHSPSGMSSGQGRVIVTMIYNIVPNTP